MSETTKCDLCNFSTAKNGLDTFYFGDWMNKNGLQVHYFCLLLSTHLPQCGKDNSGILGFEIRDIRKEMARAQKRTCMYCEKTSASIMCVNCKKYFHLVCGHTNICLFQFIGTFPSYCDSCIPPDEDRKRLIKNKPIKLRGEPCYICLDEMGVYNQVRYIYAKCCGNGYAHAKCMKKYALNAGYYLNCIWCKDKRFRDDVKYQGVFVPDRDADWELESGAYQDLHRRRRRCDMEICNCPKGRDYIGSRKWQVILCELCGAFGAHNPGCIPGFDNSKEMLNFFKCDACLAVEQTISHDETKMADDNATDLMNFTLFVNKCQNRLTESTHLDNVDLSDNSSSVETVVNYNILKYKPESTNNDVFPLLTLTQSDNGMEQVSHQIKSPEKMDSAPIIATDASIQTPNKIDIVKIEDDEDDDADESEVDEDESEDDEIVDPRVQRLMKIFTDLFE